MRAWEKNIRRVEPYVPGEQPKVDNVIKLNTNENPYPPAPKAYEAAKAFDMDKLRLYPDPGVLHWFIQLHSITAWMIMRCLPVSVRMMCLPCAS